MMIRKHLVTALALTVSIAYVAPAAAQLSPPATITPSPVVANFNFSVPVALAVAHPCRAGFVAIEGTINVAVTTTAGSNFKIHLHARGAGDGYESGPDGMVISNGSEPYGYSSEAAATGEFPSGKPAFFGHSLIVAGELLRDSDMFTMMAELEVEYVSGVPAAPKLLSLDISCK